MPIIHIEFYALLLITVAGFSIVIKDASFFDNEDELARMVATIKVIDEIA